MLHSIFVPFQITKKLIILNDSFVWKKIIVENVEINKFASLQITFHKQDSQMFEKTSNLNNALQCEKCC